MKNVKDLSYPQRREIYLMQQNGPVYICDCRRSRIYNLLVKQGICEEVSTRTYSLTEGWRKIDVGYEPPKPLKRSLDDYSPSYANKLRTMHSIGVDKKDKDQPRKIPRFTEYSNISREQHVDRILNSN